MTQINHEDIKDIPIGFPADIKGLFNQDPRYFNVRIIPLIGTVLYGKFKDTEFSLLGSSDTKKYFNRAHVEVVAKEKLRTHAGCNFRYATHKEAIPLHGIITKEIADDARQSKKTKGVSDHLAMVGPRRIG